METTTQALVLTGQDEAAIRAIVGRLEAGWNAGDGVAFGAPFAEDADYIIIDGQYIAGRATIVAGHQQIFDTFYRGSVNHGTVESIRLIRDDVALARVRWHLRFQVGGVDREHNGRNTLLLTREAAGWQIAAFQNTLIIPEGAPRPGA